MNLMLNKKFKEWIRSIDHRSIDRRSTDLRSISPQPTVNRPYKPTVNRPYTKDNKETKQKKNPDHKKFVVWWCDGYQQRFGVKYDFKHGRDASTIQRLLKIYGIEMLKQMALEFWNETEEFVVKAGYSLGIFSTKSNAMALKVRGMGDKNRLSWADRERLKAQTGTPEAERDTAGEEGS